MTSQKPKPAFRTAADPFDESIPFEINEDEEYDDESDEPYIPKFLPPDEIEPESLQRGRVWTAEPPKPEEDLPPSKTKIKQQMHELQALGGELVELGKDQLAKLDIPDSLREAIKEMHRINKFGAQRRQMQYIGKLMRDIDPEPIKTQLAIWNGTSQAHTVYMHQLERWRERLLSDEHALTELRADHPELDMQRLRSLIRSAQKERETGKPPKCFREIFQVLREIFPAPGAIRSDDDKDDDHADD